jgi:Fuc2NAc and GlcNAc transferase
MLESLLSVGVFVAASVLTDWFRKYALRSSLVDVPNWRSSHTVPTPRGGGVAIVFATSAGLLVAWALGVASRLPVLALVGAGSIVAAVGYADDRRGLSARWRLLGHFVSAAWLLHWSGGAPPIFPFQGGNVSQLFYSILAAVGIVWLTNLTNFMDGIDGIAAAEVVTVSLGGWLLWRVTGTGAGSRVLPLLLASAVAGFLTWNWPPAKIFMGDVGSGFLGICLAGLVLQAGWMAPSLFWAWIVLIGTFAVDSTVTLSRRILTGKTFYHPHRTHAYQHAAQRLGSHQAVTLLVCAINLFWLLPVAYLVASGLLVGPAAVLLAYGPLAIVAFKLDAGVEVSP